MQETQVPSLSQEDPLEKETGNTLQYSCLGNSRNSAPWWPIVHGVTEESDTTERLNNVKQPGFTGPLSIVNPKRFVSLPCPFLQRPG